MLYNRLLLRPNYLRGEFKVVFTYPDNNGLIYEDDDFTTKNYKDSMGKDTHQSTTWEISTDEEFNNIIYSSVDDTENLTTLPVIDTTIEMDEFYYIRAKFKSSTGDESEWSDILYFETYLFQSVINAWVDDMFSAIQGTT